MIAAARALISPANCEALLRDGYVVCDGFPLAAELRDDVQELSSAGVLGPNRTSFGPYVFVKPHIEEADLHDPRLGPTLPGLTHLSAWFAESAGSFAQALSDGLPELKLCVGSRAVKVQVNRGAGGCFPVHFDNPGPPCKRAVTLLLYLNPGWKPEDGGELVLMPFLEAEVVVEPLLGRAVFFLADRVAHRVLPSHAERLMMTTWFDGLAVNAPGDVNLSLPPSALTDMPATAAALRATGRQRSVSRAVYAEEYDASLRECMQGTGGGVLEGMTQAHEQHLATVQRNAPLRRLVEELRRMKPPGRAQLAVPSSPG
jgi:hypothetical protein